MDCKKLKDNKEKFSGNDHSMTLPHTNTAKMLPFLVFFFTQDIFVCETNVEQEELNHAINSATFKINHKSRTQMPLCCFFLLIFVKAPLKTYRLQ
jgi:hypothetical protein